MSSGTNKNYDIVQIREGCVKGDRKFQQMLYDLFSSKMFAVCLRYSNEYNTAQDLLQEGFIKVFKNMGMFRGDGSFEGWMRRIFVNNAIEHYRRQVNMYALHESETNYFEPYENNALETLKQEDILKMIQKLSGGYRTVFNLFVVEGYSHKEIGEMIGVSEGTSKSQLARARYLLQKMIMQSAEVAKQSSNG